MSLTEMFTSPVSGNAHSFDVSAGPLPSNVFNPELSVCSVSVLESNIELSDCPTTLKEANNEFVALSVTTHNPALKPSNPPVMSPETINASHVFHVNSVTAIDTIYELLFCPVSVSEPIDNFFVFPAPVPETVTALPRSQSLPCSTVPPAMV